MKVTFLPTAFHLASLFACTAADVTLDPFPNVVELGKTYTLSWVGTANYTYTLWLVSENEEENEYSWHKVSSLASGLYFNSLKGSYTWTVPSNLSIQVNYGLWLAGLAIPFNGASYSSVTEWFEVSSTNSTVNSGNASTTPSTIPNTTPSGITDATSSAGSSEIPSSKPHKSLSGGAIAGIVIGCISIIALIVGAVLLFHRRRRQYGVKKREAAARANRLAPVMQESSLSYEMHNRTPQPDKQTDG